MATSAAAEPRAEGPRGRVNYLIPAVPSSLYRNGRVLTRRDLDGSDAGTVGVDLEEQELVIQDARGLAGSARRTLESNGFELLPRALSQPALDFFQHEQVARDYYRECEEVVREHTGAAEVAAFDHNVRSAAGKEIERRIEGGQQVQGPAHLAHGDYTLRSGPERLRALSKAPSVNDTLSSLLEPGRSLLDPKRVERVLGAAGRFAIINLWRNIAAEPVATHPLALCDGQSVHPKDLVVFEIHYQDRVGENYFAKYSPHHRWYYYPAMTRDEALLIKQWDSAGPLARSGGQEADGDDPAAPCTFSFHSAFADPATPPDAPERWSIEVRCVVLYD